MRLTYNFSATKGRQWGQDIYTFMCPLNILDKLTDRKNSDKVQFDETYPVCRERVSRYVADIKENRTRFVGEPVILSINDSVGFKAIDQRYQEIGIVSFPMNANKALISGHELKEAVRTLLDEGYSMHQQCVIPVVLFSDEGFVMTHEHFEKFDDQIVIAAVEMPQEKSMVDLMLDKHSWMADRIDMKNKSLAKFSKKFFLKKQMASSTETLICNLDSEDATGVAERFWTAYFTQVEALQDISGYKLRTVSVFPYGTVLEGIAKIANELACKGEDDFTDLIDAINQIDWNRSNPQWQGTLVHESGRILKNRKAVEQVVENIRLHMKSTH